MAETPAIGESEEIPRFAVCPDTGELCNIPSYEMSRTATGCARVLAAKTANKGTEVVAWFAWNSPVWLVTWPLWSRDRVEKIKEKRLQAAIDNTV